MKETKTYLAIEELKAKHREVKRELLTLMGKADSPTVTKERIKDELFKLYLKVK